VERWQDEGSTRPRRKSAAKAASSSAITTSDERKASTSAQSTVDSRALGSLVAALGDRDGRKAAGKLALALDAFERERWSEVKKLTLPLSRQVGGVEFVHELLGLALYRLGQWIDAADHLEQARTLNPANAINHPVLADCYRALRRYEKVDELWRELRESSPDAAIVAEGRIVAASAQADRGDVVGAVRTMEHAKKDPAVPREHHLREWYVLADLYDRSGDVLKARTVFRKIERVDPNFADVSRRLEELGD
jgi:tetratricopeptide (TPR) repeat protein